MDHYKILGLGQNASSKEIKIAFRTLAKKYHPDKNPLDPQAEEKFKGITGAYIILSDDKKKAKYDLAIKYGKVSNSVYTASRRTQYYRRKYRPYRRSVKQVYSRQTYILVTLTVLGMIAFVLLFPMALVKFNGSIEFEKAQQHFEQEEYVLAIESLKKSIKPFSTQNYQSYRLMSEIMVYHLAHCDQAMEYIEAGIEEANYDSQKAILNYLKAKCLKRSERFESARQSLEMAVSQDANLDSAYYELGELNTYVFKDYQKGLYYFDQLFRINPNYVDALFGKAYCHQQLGQHLEAIRNYDVFIIAYPKEGMAYYLKSISEIASGDPNQACKDLNQAKSLGITGAQLLLDRHCSN